MHSACQAINTESSLIYDVPCYSHGFPWAVFYLVIILPRNMSHCLDDVIFGHTAESHNTQGYSNELMSLSPDSKCLSINQKELVFNRIVIDI